MITGAQVRAAKALLNWSGDDLAESSGVSISSIRRIEALDGLSQSTSIKVLYSIKKALERHGVEFTGSPEDGPGVKLVKK